MATQRNTIKIANPSLDGNQQSSLVLDVAVWGTTLTVTSTVWYDLTANIYLLIGNYWDQKSEIVLASAKTDSTFTVWALKYSHSASEPVTYIPYNQIKFYGREVSGWANNLLETVNIDATQQYTSYTYTGAKYSYFVTTYYREAATAEESDESDEISILTFNQYSAKKIIEAWVRRAMAKVDENAESSLSWSALIEELNNWLQEIMIRKKRWRFLHKVDTSISTSPWVQFIPNPSDLSINEYILVDWVKIEYITKMRFDQAVSTGTTPIIGKPYWYTIKNWKNYLYPTPDSVYPVTFEYYATPTEITSLTDQVYEELSVILTYYIAAMAAYIRGNEKRWDKMYAMYSKLLEQQVEDMTWYEQVWDAESIEYTSSYWPDFDITMD